MKLPKIKTILAAAVFGVTLAAASVAVASPALASSPSNSKQGFCIPISKLPVSLAPGQPYDQTVSVTYCQPFQWKNGHQVDVLTSGAGYTSEYWDWPVEPGTYSYVNKTLAQGRATVTYDRVGSGKSSKPHSTKVTLDTDAYVLFQIVKLLRLGGYGFQTVNSIGHSYGSGVVIQEATSDWSVANGGVSKIVLTGYLHDARNPIVATRNYPAISDPQFASSGLDDGYLTSKPDTRALSFYSAIAKPQVIAYDEAHKDIISRTAFIGYAGQQGAPAGANKSNAINVPVLEIVGDQDAIFCSNAAVLDCTNEAAVQAFEVPYFAAGKVTVKTVVKTGHDIALHPAVPGTEPSFNKIDSWIKTH